MRTFTYTDEKSNKFWNIDLNDTSFTVTYGRIGGAGQSKTQTFPTAAKALAEHDKLVREKTGKGYVETTAGGAAAAPPAGTAPSKGTRVLLETALAKDPDDLATHHAYGDLLIEEGDPRGELVQLQLQLENASLPAAERKKLAKREKGILADHLESWLGVAKEYLLEQRDVHEYMRESKMLFEYRFERGWIAAIRMPVVNLRSARAIARLPLARNLRELVIDHDDFEDGYTRVDGDEPQPGIDDLPDEVDEEEAALLPFFKAPFLGTLRVLQLGEMPTEDYDDYCPHNCQMNGGRAADLIERTPNVEEVRLFARGVDTKKLFGLKSLTKLRVLQVYHVIEYPIDRVAKNPAMANLTHLLLHPHALEDEPSLNLSHIKALCKSPNLPKLEYLRMRLCDAGDAGVKEIVKTGMLKRLKALDLRHGRITDEGAEMLAASPDVKHLEHLDLSWNRLTADGVAELEALKLPTLLVGQQYKVPETAADDSHENMEYLYAGDIE